MTAFLKFMGSHVGNTICELQASQRPGLFEVAAKRTLKFHETTAVALMILIGLG